MGPSSTPALISCILIDQGRRSLRDPGDADRERLSNPIDTVLVDNKMYVLDYRGLQGIWEITFPMNVPDSDAPSLLLIGGCVGLAGLRWGRGSK